MNVCVGHFTALLTRRLNRASRSNVPPPRISMACKSPRESIVWVLIASNHNEWIAATAIATLYMMPVTACQKGSGSICSALIGMTIVSPG